jgi:hypothetical protein
MRPPALGFGDELDPSPQPPKTSAEKALFNGFLR